MRSSRSAAAFLVCLLVVQAAAAQTSRSGRVSATLDAPEWSEPRVPPGPAQPPTPGRPKIGTQASSWQSGALVNTYGNDCLDLNGGWLTGPLTGSFVSYYGDPNASVPKVGDIYYTSVFVQRTAYCQGVVVNPWLIPAAGTFLAISATNPVYCYKNNVATTSGCSQAPPFGTSLSGATGYNLGNWTLPTSGSSVEILVPVVSTTSGAKTHYSRVDTADGSFNSFATPSVSYFVASNPPTIGYPGTPTTSITSTTARTTADIFNHYTAGTIFFDIGTTTSYGTSNGGNTVPNTWDSGQFYCDWSGLSPGTTYHWRARFVHAGGTVFGADRTFTTTGTVTIPTAPTGVAANALPGEANVTWSSVVGASTYEVYRRAAGSAAFILVGSTSLTSYHDTTAGADKAYLYRVRAVNAAGSSPDSASDLVTMIFFTDDTLTAGTTMVKATHLAQLRNAVSAVRTLAGIGDALYTDVAAAGTPIKAVHLAELRTYLDAARSALGLSTGGYTDALGAGVTIRTYHVQQLRDRVK